MISLCDDYGVCTLCFLCSIGITKQLGGVLKLPEVLNYVGGDFNVVRSFEERDGCSGDCRIMLAFGVFMDNIDSVDSGARWAVGGVSVWMQEELVLVGYLLCKPGPSKNIETLVTGKKDTKSESRSLKGVLIYPKLVIQATSCGSRLVKRQARGMTLASHACSCYAGVKTPAKNDVVG
ncbi:hypothetical protein V6N13_142415 [Hibiscus sabdariffa]